MRASLDELIAAVRRAPTGPRIEQMLVADPLLTHPMSGGNPYLVGIDRLIGAILNLLTWMD